MCYCNHGYRGVSCNEGKKRNIFVLLIEKELFPLVLQSMNNQTLNEGQNYVTNVMIVSGSSPVEFFLVEGPDGMQMNGTTGKINWGFAIASETSWKIRVRGVNPLNYYEVSW